MWGFSKCLLRSAYQSNSPDRPTAFTGRQSYSPGLRAVRSGALLEPFHEFCRLPRRELLGRDTLKEEPHPPSPATVAELHSRLARVPLPAEACTSTAGKWPGHVMIHLSRIPWGSFESASTPYPPPLLKAQIQPASRKVCRPLFLICCIGI